jgi:hypothetical protein
MSKVNLHQLAAALSGQVVQHGILCPGPGHSSADRSLRITFKDDDIFVHSFAGDDWRVCKDFVRKRLGRGITVTSKIADARLPTVDPMTSDADRTSKALVIWREALDAQGTPAGTYLARRGLTYAGEALRWHPACPFGRDRLGCMVALVRNVVTNAPQAIHRTAIDASGRKLSYLGANGRLSFGPVRGGAVKLTDDAEVTTVLAIGEGIETALSIQQLPDLKAMPVWSVLSAGGLVAFPNLPGIETLWLAADNDVSSTGQIAVRSAANRLTQTGMEAIIISPTTVGTDLNDRVSSHVGA